MAKLGPGLATLPVTGSHSSPASAEGLAARPWEGPGLFTAAPLTRREGCRWRPRGHRPMDWPPVSRQHQPLGTQDLLPKDMKLLENSSFEAINSQLTVETGDAHIIGR